MKLSLKFLFVSRRRLRVWAAQAMRWQRRCVAARAERDELLAKMATYRASIWREVSDARVPALPELTREELQLAFGVSREDLWYRAVRQVIRGHMADHVRMVSDPALANMHGSLASVGGGIDSLRKLLDDLDAHRRAAGGVADSTRGNGDAEIL